MQPSGRRGLLLGAASWIAFAAWAVAGGPAVAAPPPPDEPTEELPLIIVPDGCPEVELADVAFLGTVVDKDYRTVRFRIDQLRAATASPWAIDGMIDVRYGSDAQYLDRDVQYLVGAAVDPAVGVLASRVRPPEPLFGGNDVIGLDDTALECREVETGVRTLHADGTSVESGVFSPLFDARSTVLATIAIPTAVALGVLLAIGLLRVVWRWGMKGVFELGRAAVTPTTDHRAIRVRRHGGPSSRDVGARRGPPVKVD